MIIWKEKGTERTWTGWRRGWEVAGTSEVKEEGVTMGVVSGIWRRDHREFTKESE
jgi:hypothetical protein